MKENNEIKDVEINQMGNQTKYNKIKMEKEMEEVEFISESIIPSPSFQSSQKKEKIFNFKKFLPLKFQRMILKDLSDSQKRNALVVADRGLGLQEEIILTFLKQYSLQKQHLVLILNATSSQSRYIQMEINNMYYSYYPSEKMDSSRMLNDRVKTVKSLTSENRRQEYLAGGIVFVASNIISVDFLQGIVPIHLISGIIVFNAHEVSDLSYETMAIRLFREKNNEGFVKALSDSAYGFTRSKGKSLADSGITKHLDKVMSLLCINNIFLWPRFEENVQQSLGEGPRIIELEIDMTPKMKIIKTNIINLMKKAISAIQNTHKEVDLGDDITSSCLLHLDSIVSSQLLPIWNHVSRATKSLIDDLRQLRHIALNLTQIDSVLFHSLLQNIRNDITSTGTPKSDWIISNEANIIFECAKQRVYTTTSTSKVKKQRTMTQIASHEGTRIKKKIKTTLNLESLPKWDHLELLLQEIQDGIINNTQVENITNKVLIVTKNEKISSQIAIVLKEGSKKYLERCARRVINAKDSEAVKSTFEKKNNGIPEETLNTNNQKRKKETIHIGEETEEDIQSLKEILNEIIVLSDSDDDESVIFTQDESKQEFSDNFSLLDSSNIDILDISIVSVNSYNNILKIFKPTFIICYEPDLEFARRIEIFNSENPSKPLQVYFLRYIDSFDEQVFLSDCKMYQNAFLSLIKSQSSLLSINKSLNTLISENKSHRLEKINRSSRIAGGREEIVKKSIVVVDSREFRSMLPIQLNQMGMEVVPKQLNVGDYILTKTICIERKALQDLIQSLNSGRLYNQVGKMMKKYVTSAVLIQFENHQPFIFSDEFSNISLKLPTVKLVVLTIQYPHLKLLWSRSSSDTAELFQSLKELQDEPNTNEIEQAEAKEDDVSDKAINLLLQLPGVTEMNVKNITNAVNNMQELVHLSEEEMCELIGPVNGKKLYNFCNQ